MDKLEKVINGLECCILRDPDDHARCSQCSYDGNCVNRLKMDALELLKAQEPFRPFRSGGYHPDWCCGNCKYPGLYGQMKFCPECGMAVKWE